MHNEIVTVITNSLCTRKTTESAENLHEISDIVEWVHLSNKNYHLNHYILKIYNDQFPLKFLIMPFTDKKGIVFSLLR